MSKEVRGMVMGLCIVLLAVAAYFLRDRPAGAPAGTATTTQAKP